MFLIKNILVFLIGLIQTVIGGFWFTAFFTDIVGENIFPQVHFSVHILFTLLLIMGLINIYIASTNFLIFSLKKTKKFKSGFSIAMLSVILSFILFLMMKFAFSLTYNGFKG